jgi:hypothetical protein
LYIGVTTEGIIMLEIDMKDLSSLSAIAEALRENRILAATCQLMQPHCVASNEERFRPIATVWINSTPLKLNVYALEILPAGGNDGKSK